MKTVSDFLNIPPPSHRPDESPTLEHRPMPPQWQPPIPPVAETVDLDGMEESQYDEAQLPSQPAVRLSKHQRQQSPGELTSRRLIAVYG